jgi:DNA repair photolyase
MKVREIACKTALCPSGLADYALNCYAGCAHGCCYCYARYMTGFTGHEEPWGEFVDVRVNAVEALLRQLRRTRVGSVMVSSVCDGWQPLEEKYRLTRECVRLLLAGGFDVSALTKSALVTRDLDIFGGNKRVELGMTVTTLDEDLRRVIEPAASPTLKRFEALKAASDHGVRVWLFVGPLLPFLSDGSDNVGRILREASRLPLESIIFDKLNVRTGVWQSLEGLVKEHHPQFLGRYRSVLFDPMERESYVQDLRQRIQKAVDAVGMRGTRILF